ncbi:MAG: hypothetical protein ACXWJK_00075 [Burkholderiaceae bacterium]
MLKIFISVFIAAATIYLTPVTFAQEGGASTNPAIEVAFWNSVKDSRDPNELQAYLNKYPKGQFAELAVIRKQNLAKSSASSVSTGSNLVNRSSRAGNAEMKPALIEIDPKFDQFLKDLKDALSEKSRPDIRSVFPVLLPVNAANLQKVNAIANQLFRAPFPSAAAISIGPTGNVIVGKTQQMVFYGGAESAALSECESKRKGVETLLPKCEIFFRSRTIDYKVLIKMIDQARGPDFNAWVNGLNESVSSWKR